MNIDGNINEDDYIDDYNPIDDAETPQLSKKAGRLNTAGTA